MPLFKNIDQAFEYLNKPEYNNGIYIDYWKKECKVTKILSNTYTYNPRGSKLRIHYMTDGHAGGNYETYDSFPKSNVFLMKDGRIRLKRWNKNYCYLIPNKQFKRLDKLKDIL
jgi:hypothetical protein